MSSGDDAGPFSATPLHSMEQGTASREVAPLQYAVTSQNNVVPLSAISEPDLVERARDGESSKLQRLLDELKDHLLEASRAARLTERTKRSLEESNHEHEAVLQDIQRRNAALEASVRRKGSIEGSLVLSSSGDVLCLPQIEELVDTLTQATGGTAEEEEPEPERIIHAPTTQQAPPSEDRPETPSLDMNRAPLTILDDLLARLRREDGERGRDPERH